MAISGPFPYLIDGAMPYHSRCSYEIIAIPLGIVKLSVCWAQLCLQEYLLQFLVINLRL